MKTLYIATPQQVEEIEYLLVNVVGTKQVPDLPSGYNWMPAVLEDNKVSRFRKLFARITRRAEKISYVPDHGDLMNEWCYCGQEADHSMNCGECFACHVGLTSDFQEDPAYIGFHGPFKPEVDVDVEGYIQESDLQEALYHMGYQEEGPYGGAFADDADYARFRGVDLR